MESSTNLNDAKCFIENLTDVSSLSFNNGTPPSSQTVGESTPRINGTILENTISKLESSTDTTNVPAKKPTAKKVSAPRKRSANPQPRNRPKKAPQQLVQVADIPQQFSCTNTTTQVPIFHTNFVNGNSLAQNNITFIPVPPSQPQQQQPVLRGTRTILPKPASGQTVNSVQQIAAAAFPSSSAHQQTSGAAVRPQVTQVFPNNANTNSVNLQGPMLLNGQQFTMGNQQFIARMPTQMPSNPKQESEVATSSPLLNQINPPPIIRGQQQVQALLHTVQTANGPMTLAFLPGNLNPVFPGLQSIGQRFPFVQENSLPQQNTVQLNTLNNFLNSSNLLLQQQNAPTFSNPTPPSSQKEESEFNLDEFLTFGTPPPAQASPTDSQSVLEELVNGPMFQSNLPTSNGPVRNQLASNFTEENSPGNSSAKKKKTRQKKKSDTIGIQQKVEEILTRYKEEVSVDTSASSRLTPSQPLSSVQVFAPATVCPPLPVLPPPPPPLKPKKKTDLGKKRDKDAQTLKHMDLNSPFKGKVSALHRLLPFHLLSEPDERPEDLERDARAFKLVAEGLVQRGVDLQRRYRSCLFSSAADIVPRLDILTCCSTWLDSEREEFEAEKRAAECGMPVEPPPWTYSGCSTESISSYFDPEYFDLLCNNRLEEPLPVSASVMGPPPPAVVKPQITVRKSEPQSGKIKLCIKRSIQETATTPVESEPPLKKIGNVRLKLVRRPENGPDPPSAPAAEQVSTRIEDMITQTAVESILQFGEKNSSRKADERGMQQRHGHSARQPVMIGNGPSFSDSYFYESVSTVESEHEPDSALDEAIQSILG